jgi:hypothetical protein
MARRISEASRYTVCFTQDVAPGEQRFECTARDRGDALAQLKKQLREAGKPGPITVSRIVPCWLGVKR